MDHLEWKIVQVTVDALSVRPVLMVPQLHNVLIGDSLVGTRPPTKSRANTELYASQKRRLSSSLGTCRPCGRSERTKWIGSFDEVVKAGRCTWMVGRSGERYSDPIRRREGCT